MSFESHEDYQRSILKSVSRTFALTIPLLPPSLEKVVANTYLLCRIIDTIEDATCIDLKTKQDLSALFLTTLQGTTPPETFDAASRIAFSQHAHLAEKNLMENLSRVLQVFYSGHQEQQDAVVHCVQVMSEGMAHFHHRQNPHGLANLAEFERYCYVVAGVVGEMLTKLFSFYSPEFAKNISGKEFLALSFGQALQMTNILKDSAEDKSRGVSWQPQNIDKNTLLAIAHLKLSDALDYISTIPKSEQGIRRFCFLAFGLAVLTLREIHHKNKKSIVKINRSQVMRLYFFTKYAVKSDFVMTLFFRFYGRTLLRKM